MTLPQSLPLMFDRMSETTILASMIARTRRFGIASITLLCCIATTGVAVSQERLVDHFPQAAESGCMVCHGEIEPIREIGSEMLLTENA